MYSRMHTARAIHTSVRSPQPSLISTQRCNLLPTQASTRHSAGQSHTCGNCFVPFMNSTTLCEFMNFSRASFNSGESPGCACTEEESGQTLYLRLLGSDSVTSILKEDQIILSKRIDLTLLKTATVKQERTTWAKCSYCHVHTPRTVNLLKSA